MSTVLASYLDNYSYEVKVSSFRVVERGDESSDRWPSKGEKTEIDVH